RVGAHARAAQAATAPLPAHAVARFFRDAQREPRPPGDRSGRDVYGAGRSRTPLVRPQRVSRHHRADQSRAACRSALDRLPERTFNAIFTARPSAVEAYLFVPPDFIRALTRVLRLFRGWWNIAAPAGIINIECTFNAP